jgi:hypothetical protein
MSQTANKEKDNGTLSTQQSGAEVYARLPTMDKRTKGLAQCKESHTTIQNNKAGT